MNYTMYDLIAEGYCCEQCQREIDGKETGEMRRCRLCHILEARGY